MSDQLFSDATIDFLEGNGNNEFSDNARTNLVRYSPVVTAGQPVFTMPADCRDIIEITYLGYPVYPLPPAAFKEFNRWARQSNRPMWFTYDTYTAQRTIKLFPSPSQSLAAATDLDDLNQLSQTMHIAYWQNCSSANPIPDFLATPVLKTYIAKECYAIEGRAQNLKYAKYFADRYQIELKNAVEIVNDLFTKPRRFNCTPRGEQPHKFDPILPIKFGYSAEF